MSLLREFKKWNDITTGDGSITSGDVTVLSSGATTGRAYKRGILPVKAGDIIEVSFNARVTSGEIACILDLDIDAVGGQDPSGTSYEPSILGVARVNCVANEWQSYNLTYIVPSYASDGSAAYVNIGSFLTQDGNGEVTDVRVGIMNISSKQPIMVASGLIDFTNTTTITLNNSYHTNGIESLRYDVTGKAMYIKLEPYYSPILVNATPLPMVAFTPEAGAGLQLRVGSYDRINREFKVIANDSAGVQVDIPNGSYITFMAFA